MVSFDRLDARITDDWTAAPEWVVNGTPLIDLLGEDAVGMLPPLRQLDAQAAADRLLLRQPPDHPSGRTTILSRTEPDNEACIAAKIEERGYMIKWSDFVFESGNGLDNERRVQRPIEVTGATGQSGLWFPEAAYRNTIDLMLAIAAPLGKQPHLRWVDRHLSREQQRAASFGVAVVSMGFFAADVPWAFVIVVVLMRLTRISFRWNLGSLLVALSGFGLFYPPTEMTTDRALLMAGSGSALMLWDLVLPDEILPWRVLSRLIPQRWRPNRRHGVL